MKTWTSLYVICIIYAAYCGFRYMKSIADTKTDLGLTAYLAGYLVCVIFSLLATYYCLKRSGNLKLRKPSWNRNPFNWSVDVLQSLRVSLVGCGSFVIGQILNIENTSEQKLSFLYLMCAITLGLYTGERLVYLIYKNKIEPKA